MKILNENENNDNTVNPPIVLNAAEKEQVGKKLIMALMKDALINGKLKISEIDLMDARVRIK